MAEKHRRYRSTEKGKRKHRDYMKEYMQAYRQRLAAEGKLDRTKGRQYDKEAYKRLRMKAFEQLGGARCCNCGCDIFTILEINHVNGGGRVELKIKQSRQLYRDIARGCVDVTEYNVLCRVCNALHYVESVLGILGHKVYWN